MVIFNEIWVPTLMILTLTWGGVVFALPSPSYVCINTVILIYQVKVI